MKHLRALPQPLEVDIGNGFSLRLNRYDMDHAHAEVELWKNSQGQSAESTLLTSKLVTLMGAEPLNELAECIAGQTPLDLKAVTACVLEFKRKVEAHFRATQSKRRKTQVPAESSVEQGVGFPYEETEQGLVWHKPSREGAVPVVLTNFTGRILREMIVDDGVETRRHLEIEIKLKGQSMLAELSIAEFASMNWPLRHFGPNCIVHPGFGAADRVRAAIQSFSLGEFESERTFAHMGWRRIDGEMRYLHAGGAIGASGNQTQLSISLHDTLSQAMLPLPEDETQAIRAFLALTAAADPQVMVPLMGASCCAPLGCREVIVYLYGQSGGGKTSVAELVQQCYGSGLSGPNIPANWKSTSNAVRATLHEAKDALILIDDFVITGGQSERGRMEKMADDVLRSQANQADRGRSDPTGKNRPKRPPRCVTLVTGEELPPGHSLIARCFIVEVPADNLQNRKRAITACQHDARNGRYAEALAGFIRWIAADYERIMSERESELARLREAAGEFAHPRTATQIGTLAYGLARFLAYAEDRGELSEAEAGGFWRTYWNALIEVGRQQETHSEVEDIRKRFATLLGDVLMSGEAHLLDGTTLRMPDENPHLWGWTINTNLAGDYVSDPHERLSARGKTIGYLHDQNIYLLPGPAYTAMATYATRQNHPIPSSQRTFWRRLEEAGLIDRRDGHHYGIKTALPGLQARQRLICISQDLICVSKAGQVGQEGQVHQNQDDGREQHVGHPHPEVGQPSTRSGAAPHMRPTTKMPQPTIDQSDNGVAPLAPLLTDRYRRENEKESSPSLAAETAAMPDGDPQMEEGIIE